MKCFYPESKIKAFTLIETVVSISIFTICMAMAIGAFYATYKISFFTKMLEFAHADVRNTTDKIATMTRQAVYYPLIFSNSSWTYNALASISTNVTNEVTSTGTNDVRYGNEVRIMYEGIQTTLSQALTINANYMVVSNKTAISSVASIPTVFATMTSSSISNNNIRLTAPTVTSSTYDSMFIELGSNLINAAITNSIASTNGTITNFFASPFTNSLNSSVPADTKVFLGKMGRFILLNKELRFYPSPTSTTYETVITNVTTDAPFFLTESKDSDRGPLLTIDITYTSPGDVTGKGIYRITTRATMRSDPTSKNSNYIAKGGVNSDADFGTGN